MKFKGLKHLFFAAACLFLSRTMPAQTLPQLPADPDIRQGRLGCGASYYMVANPAEKGYAYVAVVQLDSLTPQKKEQLNPAFLGRMGILPGQGGFLSQKEGHTLYRFPRIPAFRSGVLDSTLLHTFAQMALSQEPQAIVVSGDIDPAELKKKMDIFSLLVPRLKDRPEPQADLPAPDLFPNLQLNKGKRASAGVSYASARIPQEQMNTTQALVTDMFAREFGAILQHRLERNLKEEGIPWQEIRLVQKGSSATAGYEQYGVQILTAPEYLLQANRVLTLTLAEWKLLGVPTREFTETKRALEPRILQQASGTPSNEENLSRCIAHFLYGAQLAPFSEEAKLFTRKVFSEDMEALLFNSFSSALLQQLTNLTLSYTAAPDSLDYPEALFRYNLNWLYGQVAPYQKDYSWHRADSLGMEPALSRVRIKSEKTEPVSGGTLWTFSNNIRVAYKQIKGEEPFHFALQLNGGLSRIPDLKEGEGGYIPEMLSLYDAGGLQAAAFRDQLASNGVQMSFGANLNNLFIKGSAPEDKLAFVLKALIALSNERRLNEAELEAYIRNGKLCPQTVKDRMEALIAPHYQYSSGKRPEALSPETARKAERFFAERFSKVDDGMLILSGNLDPATVKKLLLKYIGSFRTSSTSPVSRKQVHFRTLSGVNTYAEDGPERGLYVLMDADLPLTALNYATSFVAGEAVRSALAEHLADAGLQVEVETSLMSHPQERMRMLVRCTPVVPDGEFNPTSALAAVRLALQEAAAQEIGAQDLAGWKAYTTNRLQTRLSSPEGVVNSLLARYGAGKNLTSRYKENISAVTAERVNDMLTALTGGGRIEYFVP